MTAKEALLEAVEAMTEERAAEVLYQIRGPWRPFPPPSVMRRMSKEELDLIFEMFPVEVDMEEHELWENGTWDAILHIDD